MRQSRDCASQTFGHIRVERGKSAHVELVDQPAALEARFALPNYRKAARNDCAGNQPGGILAEPDETRVLQEAAVELDRVRIDQKLGNIEPQALFRSPFARGAVAITRAAMVAR